MPREEVSLLYRDVPKAGGSTTVKLLHEMLRQHALGKTRVLLAEEYGPLEPATGDKNGTDVLFIMGGIRDPCDYYVSLWAYEQESAGGPGGAFLRDSRANSAIFKVRDFACFCGSKYVPSMLKLRGIFVFGLYGALYDQKHENDVIFKCTF